MNIITQQHMSLSLLIWFLTALVSAFANPQNATIPATKQAELTHENLTTMRWQLADVARARRGLRPRLPVPRPNRKLPGMVGQGAMARLESMNWQLVSIPKEGSAGSRYFQSGPRVSRYSLHFMNGFILIRGGCNILRTSYKLAAGKKITTGSIASTRRGCRERGLMEADFEIAGQLRAVTGYTFNGRHGHILTLTTKFQQRLVLRGTPTNETLYGKGVRKFIEIINSSGSIRWREIRSNSSRVRNKDKVWWNKGKVLWNEGNPNIQSFTPRANLQYVVRIYEYNDPSTRGVIWVKDMVTFYGRGIFR